MKKCVVALFGSSVRAIETIPRSCFRLPGSSGTCFDIRSANSWLLGETLTGKVRVTVAAGRIAYAA